MVKIVGIDPGISGAIAILDLDNNTLTVGDMPTVIVLRNKKNRTDMDVAGLVAALEKDGISNAYVEQVGAKPTDGTVGAFTFGKSFGMILGVLGAMHIKTDTIIPQKWKKKFSLIGEEKDTSRERASEYFPLCSKLWKFKKNGGRAEAALIALYAALELGYNPSTTFIEPGI